jgi:hypothetical protein
LNFCGDEFDAVATVAAAPTFFGGEVDRFGGALAHTAGDLEATTADRFEPDDEAHIGPQ